jgi:hypothetical protein
MKSSSSPQVPGCSSFLERPPRQPRSVPQPQPAIPGEASSRISTSWSWPRPAFSGKGTSPAPIWALQIALS